MKQFIKLTDIYCQTVVINTDKIIYIEQDYNNQYTILFQTGNYAPRIQILKEEFDKLLFKLTV